MWKIRKKKIYREGGAEYYGGRLAYCYGELNIC